MTFTNYSLYICLIHMIYFPSCSQSVSPLPTTLHILPVRGRQRFKKSKFALRPSLSPSPPIECVQWYVRAEDWCVCVRARRLLTVSRWGNRSIRDRRLHTDSKILMLTPLPASTAERSGFTCSSFLTANGALKHLCCSFLRNGWDLDSGTIPLGLFSGLFPFIQTDSFLFLQCFPLCHETWIYCC